jgi:hypothetical protein
MFYKIRIMLRTPVAFQTKKKIQPIHFDGLLTALSVFKDGIFDNPIPQDTIDKVAIPLNRTGKVYKASCMKIDQSKSKIYRDIWTGSTSWVNYIHFKGKLNNASGIFRAKAGILMLLVTPYLEFYFDSNDINSVISLLNNLRFIGSRVGTGYGEIKDMEISKSEKDYSLLDEKGYPARHIPINQIDKADLRWNFDYVGYKSPYYFYPFYEMCYIPPVNRYWVQKKVKDVIASIVSEKKDID